MASPQSSPSIPLSTTIPKSNIPVLPKRTYPGMYSDMSAMAQMVLRPDVFDGCRFEIAKGFNEKFAVTHSLLIGSSFLPPPGRVYQIGTTYTPTRETMLMGRLNPADGAVKMIVAGPLSSRSTVKVNCDLNRAAAAEPVPSSGVFDVQYKGDDWSFGAQSQIVEGDAPTLKFSFLQSLTTKLVAGCEGTYQSGKAAAHVSLGARYAGADFMASSNYSFSQGSSNSKIECHFMKKVDPKVSLAASLTCVPKQNVAAVALGYVFNLQTAKVSATVHSNWQMHATLEEHIAPGFSLLFSGLLDHSKEQYKFGVGLQVGQ
jgi:mitochondrial import receptor subunit TOM40|tara:strand:+ start:2040 stop:2987 length:948 start_codon:yes stop_codon:yes gene_type:complete